MHKDRVALVPATVLDYDRCMLPLKEALGRAADPELLRAVLEEVAKLPAELRGFEGHTFTIVRILAEREVPVDERATIAVNIGFRLRALGQLTENGGGRGWTLNGKPGFVLVHEELIRCAAEEPLIEVDDQPAFDPESFHRRLLLISEMRGKA